METLLNGRVITWTGEGPAGFAMSGHALKADNGEIVWIDPPDPGSQEAAVLAFGKPAHILVTFRDHDRAVDQYAKRFGAKVWIPRGKGGAIKKVDVEYDEATALPAGLRALSLPAVGFGEHALYGTVNGQRFAFIGDAVFHLDFERLPWIVRALAFVQRGGALQHKRWYRGGNTRDALKQARKLLDLNLDALFFSHGRPLESNAAAALKESLGTWP